MSKSIGDMLKDIIEAEERMRRGATGIGNYHVGIDTNRVEVDPAHENTLSRAMPSSNRVDHDPVHRPQHYKAGDIYETIRVIEAWGLNYHLGNTVKYISRAGKKGDIIEDLEKARWYLDREIDRLKKERMQAQDAV